MESDLYKHLQGNVKYNVMCDESEVCPVPGARDIGHFVGESSRHMVPVQNGGQFD